MKTATKVVLSVFAVPVSLWLAGSAYFLSHGRDDELKADLFPAAHPLAPEENAFAHFEALQGLRQTNFNFTVANDFLNGKTNGPAVLAEVEALVEAHSNLYACVRTILDCRGIEVPEGRRRREVPAIVCYHAAPRLLQMKAFCEASRGNRRQAQDTIDELIAFGRFVRKAPGITGWLLGNGWIGAAIEIGGRAPIAAPEDCDWRRHLMEILAADERESAEALATAMEQDLVTSWQEFCDIRTNSQRRLNLLLQDGLEGMDLLLRKIPLSSGMLSVGLSFDNDRIDRERVDRLCLTAVLSCCRGYGDYAFKPGKAFNAQADVCRDCVRKLREGVRDGEGDWSRVQSPEPDSPLTENHLGLLLARRWDARSFYADHYMYLFGTRTVRLRLACENYRAAHGRYPAALADLVPAQIDALPTDPIDGKTIRYNAEHAYFWTPGPNQEFDGGYRVGHGYHSKLPQ